VLFVEGELVFCEEVAEFLFEGFGAMVFTLVLDVGGDGFEIGLGDGEGGIAGLP